jgi:hypothetical protein
MLQGDCLIVIGVGVGFIILGIIGILWGRHEEKTYFDSLAARPDDMREFMEHWPSRPQPGAVRTGGWIAIAIGVIMLIVGIILWLLAGPPA